MEDHPGAEPRFQVGLFAKDIATFILLPALVAIFLKSCEGASQATRKQAPKTQTKDYSRGESGKSQIIEFKVAGGRGTGTGGGNAFGFPRRSPGTLIKVKLMNVVETYSTAPVHAQIVDSGLGQSLSGGTLIGDATPDSTFERITINFRFARDPNREGVAVPVAARALGLDGTLGLVANKKEGFVTRSVLGSAGAATNEAQSRNSGPQDLGQVLLRALSAGLLQEFGSSNQVERNRAQVLTLQPSTEFFAELTDFFPGSK